MKAVIMAGGKGTRLQGVNREIPKPMFPVLGKPILLYQIESLKKQGITEITVIVGYLGEVIREYLRDGAALGVRIDYIMEEHPLGTAGALYYLKNRMTEDFFLVFGDLMLDVDWERFMAFHRKHQATVTLFSHPNSHPFDSDLIMRDETDRVTGIDSKNNDRSRYFYHNFVNAGLYCVSPLLLQEIPAPEKIDFEKTILRKLIDERKVAGYHSTEYVKDMGTPDRLQAVTKDVEAGLPEAKSLRNPQRAIFLDRDGTINVWKGFLRDKEDFELIPGAAEAIRRINRSRYLAIVISNQPVIARGELTLSELQEMHRKMETLLGREGAYLDGIYFCPHHPDRGFPGEVPELKFDCDCRKPKIGLLTQAEERYHIDLGNSVFIGDSTTDIQTGVNAGCHTVLVKTGQAGEDHKYEVSPGEVHEDILAAVRAVLERT